MKNKYVIFAAIFLLGGIVGYLINTSSHQAIDTSTHQEIDTSNHQHIAEIWTCSMHPQIRLPEPGDCPICGMDLIPLNSDESNDNALEIKMSPTAMQLANVQTAIVKKGKPIKELRLNGKIQVNESAVYSQTSHLTGRVEKLLINTTGEYVSRGQIIAFIYSPELITAQEELFQAQKIKETNPQLFNAAKEKLKNWKLTEKQISAILASGQAAETFPILADVSGVVTAKKVNLGDYINQGTTLYEVADLSKVWVLFDVYESDMSWVKVGDEIEYTVQSLPNEKFKGKVSFIEPVINPKTRVSRARVVVANASQKLKPEMFVSGKLESPLKSGNAEITVPKTAVMWTGEKSVVYVKSTDGQGVSFQMRKVTLGASLGDLYVIKDGLKEDEEIAVNGTFSIDAAAQLAGKPSMMDQEIISETFAISTQKVVQNEDSKKALAPLFKSYMELKNALVEDDFTKSKILAKEMNSLFSAIKMSDFSQSGHDYWMKYSPKIQADLNKMLQSKNIEAEREIFIDLSIQMLALAQIFKPLDETIFVQHCPMANKDKGADWLSLQEEIKNPYFGESMLGCGEVKQEIK